MEVVGTGEVEVVRSGSPSPSSSPKIVDAFLFYNELDLLTYRLRIMDKVADYFVIVESTHTFAGKEKRLYYKENAHLYEAYHNKIIHVVVDDMPYKYPNIHSLSQPWENEYFQRNAISRGINQLLRRGLHKNTEAMNSRRCSCYPRNATIGACSGSQNEPIEESCMEPEPRIGKTDWILITDVDEIPDPRTILALKPSLSMSEVRAYKLEMDMYYYSFQMKCDGKWTLGKFVMVDEYQTTAGESCQTLRHIQCQALPDAGWHLSYFGDSAFIQNKIMSFSHQDLNVPEYTDIDKIAHRVKTNTDLYDRPNNVYLQIPIAENTRLPPDVGGLRPPMTPL
jgi:beta-1,4-mannosyl-glycoprotein beta-1,4-N-acetylglucosaminyltransferase